MDHRDIQRAAAMAKMNADKLYSAPGGIMDAAGNLIAVAGQYTMLDDEPRPDEIVYQVHRAWLGPEHLHLEPKIKRGIVMMTFQVPGGSPDDVAMVFLKGVALPPKGMRLAIRILAPAKEEPDAKTAGEETARPVQAAREEQTSSPPAGRDRRSGRGAGASGAEAVLEGPTPEPGTPPDSAV